MSLSEPGARLSSLARRRRFRSAGSAADSILLSVRTTAVNDIEGGPTASGEMGSVAWPEDTGYLLRQFCAHGPRPVRSRSRTCENVREPRKRRIVFFIAFLRQPSPELLVFRLTKSRRTFYAEIERGSFRTASVERGPSRLGIKCMICTTCSLGPLLYRGPLGNRERFYGPKRTSSQ